MASPFQRVAVMWLPDAQLSRLVQWWVDPKFLLPDFAVSYFVERAYAGGEWTRLNPTAPITDECVFHDASYLKCTRQNDLFYRVVLHVAAAPAVEFTSYPVDTMGKLPLHDWRIIRDMVRKHYLALRKGSGTPGQLLKRHFHGPKCLQCRDPDTEELQKTRCPYCYGTGFIRGYYNAIPFWIAKGAVPVGGVVEAPRGWQDSRRTEGTTCLAWPGIDVQDVWVEETTGRRYLILKYVDSASYRGVPILYRITEMSEIHSSDPVYQVPLEQVPEPTPDLPDPPAEQVDGWARPPNDTNPFSDFIN